MASDRSKRILSRSFQIYRWISLTTGAAMVGYLLLISFPQVLLANSTTYGHFKVHAMEPIDEDPLHTVLDRAEEKLRTSPLYDPAVERRIYLTGGFGTYALFSNKAWRSFANSVPFINNIIVSKSDLAADKVFVNRSYHDQRSLSGVIAHETTHLFIRNRYGTISASLMPTWKNEGYCEYIAGESTIPLVEGIRLWRESPSDDMAYRYVKYHAMVKYLLEKEGMSVDQLFTTDLDENEIAAKALASY